MIWHGLQVWCHWCRSMRRLWLIQLRLCYACSRQSLSGSELRYVTSEDTAYFWIIALIIYPLNCLIPYTFCPKGETFLRVLDKYLSNEAQASLKSGSSILNSRRIVGISDNLYFHWSITYEHVKQMQNLTRNSYIFHNSSIKWDMTNS